MSKNDFCKDSLNEFKLYIMNNSLDEHNVSCNEELKNELFTKVEEKENLRGSKDTPQ